MLDRIKKEDYYKLLKTYNFHFFPRAVGNPYQIIVSNFDELWDKFLEWNGNSAVFNCHNGFRDIRTILGKAMPQEIWYTSVHFDFDDAKKIENAHYDAIKLSRFLDEENIPRLTIFSGGKGFGIFLLTKPHLYKFSMVKRDDKEYSNQDAIKKITKAIQDYLKNKLELRTMDSACVGTPKKQSRALYSFHRFTRSDDNPHRVAIPLTDEQLYEWNVEDIKVYSHNPRFIIPEVRGEKYMKLLELFEYFNINMKVQEKKVDYADYRNISDRVTDKSAKLFLDVVAEYKPCITSEMMSNNPMHKIRLAFGTFAKKLGMSKEKFTKIYETIGYSIPYVDIHYNDTREYQIDWIWNSPSYRSEATCDMIKQMGKCLKYKCRRYKQ